MALANFCGRGETHDTSLQGSLVWREPPLRPIKNLPGRVPGSNCATVACCLKIVALHRISCERSNGGDSQRALIMCGSVLGCLVIDNETTVANEHLCNSTEM